MLAALQEKEGSTFAVRVELIKSIQPHPNADRLEIAEVLGWQTVVQKGAFKAGDKCLYFPIDSILPGPIEGAIFGPDSKVKLSKSRVKTIKLRGAISQGLIVPPSLFFGPENPKVGEDFAEFLGITKYEPPVKDIPGGMNVKKQKKLENPNFHKYGGIENFKNYPDLFHDEELVYVTEKIHGTNFRAGYVPTVANTIWKKVLKLLRKLPEFEFVYGSNNVQLQHKNGGGFYSTNVYREAVEKYNLETILKPGEVIYGEIYGAGIQKGYTYGCDNTERKLVVFDLRRPEGYAAPDELIAFCTERNLPIVPEIYRGPFNKEAIKALTIGDSILAPTQKVREGVVVKPTLEEKSYIGRKLLKVISDEYLLADNTDFH